MSLVDTVIIRGEKIKIININYTFPVSLSLFLGVMK